MMPRTRLTLSAALIAISTAIPAASAQRVAATTAAPETPRRVVRFSESAGPVDNPERGFSWAVDLLGTVGFEQAKSRHGVTLIRANARLDAYRAQDLPAELLAVIDQRLTEARKAGVKVIVRFSYNEGPHPNPQPDASLAWIKRHIAQLTPNLQKHSAVIAWMEAGFIGAWGEWHGSTNGLDRDPSAKREVVDALLAALPASRSIQLRVPADVAAIRSATDTRGGPMKSRVGHHNDCFLASDDDSGTYGRGQRSIAQDKALVATLGRAAPVGGETCKVNPPRSECPTALAELATLGFSELNLAYHPGVLDEWRRGGCFDTIQARLGHRLTIEEIALPPALTRGQEARITMRIANTGFAAPKNARPVLLVLDGPVKREFELPFDPRTWHPGRTHVVDVLAAIPGDIPAGAYSLALRLPDASPALRDDPRYAIQLANDGMWNAASGSNRVIDGVSVR